jgi:hypothetical protein
MQPDDPRQVAYAAARAVWMREVWPALERQRLEREMKEAVKDE